MKNILNMFGLCSLRAWEIMRDDRDMWRNEIVREHKRITIMQDAISNWQKRAWHAEHDVDVLHTEKGKLELHNQSLSQANSELSTALHVSEENLRRVCGEIDQWKARAESKSTEVSMLKGTEDALRSLFAWLQSNPYCVIPIGTWYPRWLVENVPIIMRERQEGINRADLADEQTRKYRRDIDFFKERLSDTEDDRNTWKTRAEKAEQALDGWRNISASYRATSLLCRDFDAMKARAEAAESEVLKYVRDIASLKMQLLATQEIRDALRQDMNDWKSRASDAEKECKGWREFVDRHIPYWESMK